MTEPEPSGTALAEALHRAADALPPPALPGDLWTRGRRERRRRVVRRVGAVVAAVVAAALGLPALGVVAPPVVGPAATTVSGYPMRINHQWVVRELPARPGPLAALIKVQTVDTPTEWHAVSPSGHQWRFRSGTHVDAYPALSADGRYLGYLEPDGAHVAIRDLVTGRTTRFSGITDGTSGPGITSPAQGLLYPSQSPVYFSPDGLRLAFSTIRIGTADDRQAPVVVAVFDRRSGSTTEVPLPGSGTERMIGWSGPDSVWLVGWPGPSSQAVLSPQTVDRLTLTDLSLDGRIRSRRTLEPRERPVTGATIPRRTGLRTDWLSQWTGPVTADGRRIALLGTGFGDTADYAYDSAFLDVDGGVTNFPAGAAQTCPASWLGQDLAFSAPAQSWTQTPAMQTQVLTGVRKERDTTSTDQHVVAVVSPRVGATCVIWAGNALAAGPTGWHPFGTSTARWTWYWPELTATALVVVLATAALVIRRRTRRSRIS